MDLRCPKDLDWVSTRSGLRVYVNAGLLLTCISARLIRKPALLPASFLHRSSLGEIFEPGLLFVGATHLCPGPHEQIVGAALMYTL